MLFIVACTRGALFLAWADQPNWLSELFVCGDRGQSCINLTLSRTHSNTGDNNTINNKWLLPEESVVFSLAKSM